MTKPLLSTRSFAWHGQEGSVTDRDAGLVYMQARHYDPSIGRFIQADTIPLASLTTPRHEPLHLLRKRPGEQE